jgi:hypothetical protein
MDKTLHIWPHELAEQNDSVKVSATFARDGQKSYDLWFRVPAACRSSLSRSCDPFVLGALFTAMRTSKRMVVHGGVSSSLLQNLEEFQAVWISWLPTVLSDTEISAEMEYEDGGIPTTGRAIMAFSGGLDSCFTAYRHSKRTCGRLCRDIRAGVLVHGLDIPLENANGFELASDRSRSILSSLGMQLIPMATNIRSLGENWDMSHGAAIAACLMLLQNGYAGGMVGASFSYDSLHLNIPWGSNPVTDSLLSTTDFPIINDGSRYSRIEKLRQISGWPEAMANMRVCWEGDAPGGNCCRCEKCIRAILSCHVLGMSLPPCFEHDITEQQVMSVKVPDLAILFEYRCMLSTARANGAPSRLVRLLDACIRENERRLTNSGVWRQFRAKLALRRRASRLYGRWLGLTGGDGVELRKV